MRLTNLVGLAESYLGMVLSLYLEESRIYLGYYPQNEGKCVRIFPIYVTWKNKERKNN